MLNEYIDKHKSEKDILLMTHLVLGYPSFDENRKVIEEMATAGVELIELQIPFSEPTADGPVILKANSESLKNNTRVEDCIIFAKEMCSSYPEVSFLFMTYYNIIFVFGEKKFAEFSKQAGIKGFIIPDLPLEEAEAWLGICEDSGLESIFIFTPTHSKERLREISDVSKGFIYCVGRRGVTGIKTDFGSGLSRQIEIYRESSTLPLALGFGVQDRSDVEFLTGKVDIAVIGSQVITIHESKGAKAVGEFLQSIRPHR